MTAETDLKDALQTEFEDISPTKTASDAAEGMAAAIQTHFEAAGGEAGTLTHADLGGLGADDHYQYALLGGRAGGQTLIGGTQSGNDLNLLSTAHATPGGVEMDGVWRFEKVSSHHGATYAELLIAGEATYRLLVDYGGHTFLGCVGTGNIYFRRNNSDMLQLLVTGGSTPFQLYDYGLNLNNRGLVFSEFGASNIDHIWHDDAGPTVAGRAHPGQYYLVSDATYKSTAPSKRSALNCGQIVQENWSSVVFQNGWQNYGGVWATAQYYRDREGRVHLKGLIRSGTIGTTAFNLPAQYRPAQQLLFDAISNNGQGRVEILTNGNVLISTVSSNVYVSLDGISFRAEQ